MSEIRQIFESDYCGIDTFLTQILSPIFGDYEKGYDVLTADKDVKEKANQANILEIKHAATFDFFGSELKVFDITVGDEKKLENNRVGIQSIVRLYIAQFEGALIVFHHKNVENQEWRLSYVEKRTNAKDSTSAKRYTYILGKEHPAKTITENFKKLEQNKDALVISDLTTAFSVAPLSNEFFDEYRELYAGLVEYISGKRFVKKGGKFVEEKTKNANGAFKEVFGGDDKLVRDYVKKMMGRLVFLHFLQRKGWLGVSKNEAWGNGDKNFIYNLFANASEDVKKDFLVQALEPLFFKTLNTDRGEDAVAPKSVCDIYGSKIRIPYLNGGLFEEDELDKKKVKFKKEHFESLLNFFNQYNFTIDETDPDDQEIGVDPEMLGKIFENLLEDNKDKGAFYTPKEIVQYMCRESLIAYLNEKLKIENGELKIRDFVLSHDSSQFNEGEKSMLLHALLDVKICDPAVGSGAFPMGMLNELLACTQLLTGKTKTRSDLKKHIVKNNIYGVDIEKGAVDIARLRFWLAIVVDEEDPIPLPNLDYKIMQGNSLLESYEGIDLGNLCSSDDSSLFDDSHDISVLLEYLKNYFDKHEEKNAIRDAIKATVLDLLKHRGISGKAYDELEKIDLHSNSEFFLWHTWFSDVFNRPNDCNGFDIVIGNPPYIKEYTSKSAFDGFRETSPYYMGKMDLWYGFACHGIDLLKTKGILCFIAQNNWTTSSGAKLMRKKVLEDSKILQMLDFNTYMVFESADIQTMVMLFEKNATADKYTFDYRTLLAAAEKDDMLSLLKKQDTEKTKYLEPKIDRTALKDKLLTFSGNDDIFEKIANGKLYLQDNEVAQGIVPNPDVVNSRNIKNLTGTGIKIGEGVFVVDKSKFENLAPVEQKYIKPLYEPCQMTRYYINEKNDKCILYITKSNWKNDAPTLFEHLKRYRAIMEQRRENQNGRIDFYHLHWARDEKFFNEGSKILSVRKCAVPTFVYYEKLAYVMMSVNVIQTSRWNMKFLTGVLNSKLIAFWLKNKGKMQGSNYQVDKEPLLNIPLPSATPAQQKPVITLVDKILAAKKANPQADTSKEEAEIDRLVYELYGLSEDEIKVVEGR